MSYDPKWTIHIGGTARRKLHIQERDSSDVLQDVDITGATFVCKLRDKLSDAGVVATPTVTIVTAASGTITIDIDEATTANLSVGSGVWDCWMSLNSDVLLVATGTYRIVQRVAR